MKRPPDLPTLRALWWARRSLRRVRADLAGRPLVDVRVAPPPTLPVNALRGVRYALRKLPGTCLEQALVLQAWHFAHGDPRAVVIGVTASRDFAAHAWLDGEPTASDQAYEELLRLPAR
jgi:hypothetical protein